MKSIRALAVAAILYILVAPIMLYADHLASPGSAHAMAWPLVTVASVYFITFALHYYVVSRPFMSNSRSAVAAVMVSSVVRILITAIMLLIYCVACENHRMVFVINLMVYYLITLVLSSMAASRMEKLRKSNASSSLTNE